jgi:hypothetical protein
VLGSEMIRFGCVVHNLSDIMWDVHYFAWPPSDGSESSPNEKNLVKI